METGWAWGGVGGVASMAENEALIRLGGMERVCPTRHAAPEKTFRL